jgi:hypothetical protein
MVVVADRGVEQNSISMENGDGREDSHRLLFRVVKVLRSGTMNGGSECHWGSPKEHEVMLECAGIRFGLSGCCSVELVKCHRRRSLCRSTIGCLLEAPKMFKLRHNPGPPSFST